MTDTLVWQHYQHYPLIHLLNDKNLDRLPQSTLLKVLVPLPHGVKRILDAGCGAGAVMERFNQKFWHRPITAVDFSSSSLEQAKKLAPADYRQEDINQLSFKTQAFDLVVSNGVLHHLPDYQSGLEELARVLKPSGWLYVTLYNPVSVYRFFYWLAAPLRRCYFPALVDCLSIFYWPVYCLANWVFFRTLARFREARADLADRFFHPQVSFIPKLVFIKAAKKYKLKLIASGSHALKTMNSFLFKKYA